MNYQQLIQHLLRKSHDTLSANLPPQNRLTDARAVEIIRALVSTPTAQKAVELGSDTLCAFALRALNRIVSDTRLPPGDVVTRLWDILDEPKLRSALGIDNRRMNIWMKKPPA